jgi:hypothetical protein
MIDDNTGAAAEEKETFTAETQRTRRKTDWSIFMVIVAFLRVLRASVVKRI